MTNYRIVQLKDHSKISSRFWYKREIEDVGTVIVALKDKTIMGFVYFTEELDSINLLFIEVLYEYRKSGIGTGLVNYLVKRAKGRRLNLIPENYISSIFFKDLIEKGILPKDTSLEG